MVDGVRVQRQIAAARRAAANASFQLQTDTQAAPKPKHTRKKKQQAGDGAAAGGSWTGGAPGIIIGPTPPLPPMRVRAEGLIKLTNTGTNICDTYLRVALDDGTGATTGTIALYCSRLASYKPLFRRYRLVKLHLQWVPSTADTADGAVGVCYDTDIRLGQLNTISNTMLRPCHFMTPIRVGGGRLTFVPKARVDKEERYCTTATSGGTTRSVEETQYGTIGIVSDNGLANGVGIGYLRMVADVEFTDQI